MKKKEASDWKCIACVCGLISYNRVRQLYPRKLRSTILGVGEPCNDKRQTVNDIRDRDQRVSGF